MLDVTIRIIQIDGEAEIRLNPQDKSGYRQYRLTPQQLLNIATDALNAYCAIISGNHA